MSYTPPPSDSTNTKELPKLTFAEKFGFGSGDLASNLIWASGGTFLNFFYTDIFKLSPIVITMVLVFSRIFDGFVDVAIGTWADRTNTKWGKFRPFILWWVLPVAVLFAMNYTVPPKSWDKLFFTIKPFHILGMPMEAIPITGYFVYAWATATLLMALYSAINIPYGALSGVMTNDPQDRNSLGSFRMGMANVGGLMVTALTFPLMNFFGKTAGSDVVDKAKGYQGTVFVFAILLVIFFLITFFNCKERIQPPPAQKTNFKEDFATLFKNKPWIIMSTFAIINMSLVFLRLGDMYYYFHYSIGLMDKQMDSLPINLGFYKFEWGKESFLWTWGSISFITGTFFTKAFVNMFGKVKANIIATALSGLLLIPFYFVPRGGIGLVILFTFVSQIFGGVAASLYWSMLGDIADYSEWKFKLRNTGLIFSSTTFAQKMGIAIGGGGILNIILWHIHYVPDVAQSPDALHGINVMMGLIPGIGTFLIAFLFLGYELDETFLAKMRADLAERRAQRPPDVSEMPPTPASL